MTKVNLSLCMIVKNEENLIENCLGSVKELVDEIIIVDTGSSDRTIELCKKYTENIFSTEWKNDFSGPRNLSISKAKGEWILILDADEVISQVDHDKIKRLILNKKACAYKFDTRNYTNLAGMVGWQPNDFVYPESKDYKGWVISTKTRLFRNNMELFFKGEVHEMIDPELKRRKLLINKTEVPIHHYGRFIEKNKIDEKTKRYLNIGLEKLKNNPDSFQANFEIGLQYREIKDINTAMEYFRKTIQIEPRFALAYSELGVILGLKGRIREAIDTFKKGLSFSPNNADICNNLGFTYEAINNLQKAEEYYINALKIFPESETAKRNLENVIKKKIHNKASISLCMIVKNEEENLEELLSTVYPYFEEIIIVDTGSSDSTCEISKKYEAKVYNYIWKNDFASARNESLRHATSDWIIWMDADDRVYEEDLKKIRSVIKQTSKNNAYYCILSNIKKDEIETTCNQMRIFPNLKGIRFERPIHEQVIFSLNELKLKLNYTDIIINHTGYKEEDITNNKIKRNIEIIEKQLLQNPDDFHLKFQLASSLVNLNEIPRSIELLKEIINISPEITGKDMHLYSLVFLGKIIKSSNTEEAEKFFIEALSKDSTYGLGYFCLGELYFEKEEWEKSAKYLEQVKLNSIKLTTMPIKKEKIESLVYYYLGKIYHKMNKMDEMEENFDKILYGRDSNLEKKFDIATIYIKEKKYIKAYNILKILYEKEFQIKDTMFYMALIKLYQGNIRESKLLFEQIISLYPDMYEGYLNLGVIEEKADDYEKALYYYQKAFELESNNFNISADLAHLYLKMGNAEKAKQFFVRASEINSEVSDIQAGLAVIQAYEINTASSCKNDNNASEHILNMFNNLENIWSKLILIEKIIPEIDKIVFLKIDKKFEWLGDLNWNNKKFRDALLCYQVVSLINYDEKYYYEKLINYYLLKGDIVNTVKVIEFLLSIYPEDQDLLSKLGRCYSKLKIPEAARLCFEQILKHNPLNPEALHFMSCN